MNSNTNIFKYALSIIMVLLLLNSGSLLAAQKQSLCVNNLASPITNFCVVKSNILWRGAKPDKDDLAWLIKNGVKTIVNLELLYDDLHTLQDTHFIDSSTYKVDYFRVRTWEPLFAFAKVAADEDVIHFLAIASQAKQPIFVHCRAGENRTGVMVAAYKIILENQNSPTEIATILNEMQSYNGVWSDTTTKYIKELILRRDEILKRVKTFTIEQPIQIMCKNGKCTSNYQYFGSAKK
jgi:protein tyrosine/serine phosphatase